MNTLMWRNKYNHQFDLKVDQWLKTMSKNLLKIGIILWRQGKMCKNEEKECDEPNGKMGLIFFVLTCNTQVRK